MDKLKLAHDYAIALINSDCEMQFDKFIQLCWNYADEMQAEAEKREDKERPDVLLTKDKDGNCLHFHRDFGRKKCMDCGASLEEWQPDWSQAPDGYNWFCVGSNDGYGFFSNQAPELFDDYYFVGADGFVVNNHGYQGNWKNSLRKRPQ